MLRILRVVMFALIPMIATAAIATGCDDDTATPPDMTMIKPPDMAHVDMAKSTID